MFRARIVCLSAALLLWGLSAAAAPGPGRRGHKSMPLFQTSDRCFPCHNSLTTPAGEDISIGLDWRPTLMANSARDPYWQAGVRRETIDHPESRAEIEDECSVCHMPMARYQAKAEGRGGEVFAHLPFNPKKEDDRLAADGVSCSLCHQITNEKFGTRASFVGGFVVDAAKPKGERLEYGPFDIDAGHSRVMRTSSGFEPTEAAHIRQSELCATCHTLYTRALGPQGKVIGELPEQMPYQEWLHSSYRGVRSCQSCHMPQVQAEVPVTSVFGEPRAGFSRHVFVGGNFFIQRLLNRFRADLNPAAQPQELESAAVKTVENLQTLSAAISIPDVQLRSGRLTAKVHVENLGGHKLPTAYPARRVWLHVTVRDSNGRTVFESGALEPSGLIRGNDNDADPRRYEPHWTEISSPDQVQIYEAVMADASGAPTTALLSAVRYIKDNRLLPRGFDKRTAEGDIAVRGEAADDPDFLDTGDTVTFSVAVGGAPGPFLVEAELWYQPIAYRWAQNLKPYDAPETRRFVGFYESMSASSAVMLVRAIGGQPNVTGRGTAKCVPILDGDTIDCPPIIGDYPQKVVP